MNFTESKNYFNKKPVEYVISERFNDLKEDREYIPRFSLKGIKDFENIPINEPIKYNESILLKAIKYGMIFLINYKGEKDKRFAGSERVIYPLVIGRSSKGKVLIRGWHLNGWSVSNNRHIQKIWRLFRADRILSMTFTGSFYRLPPAGYNMNDKGMRGGIIARADFNEIRRYQQKLVSNKTIQNREEVSLSTGDQKFVTISVKSTSTNLDLKNPFENSYLNNVKDNKNLRISFLKSIYGSKYISILGAMGESGNTVKVLAEGGKNIGVFKVLDSTTGDVLKNIKNIKGNTDYELYIFDRKI
jgi:hypothetical protein